MTLPRADRWFRLMGLVSLGLLGTTLGMLIAGFDGWRPVFALAHLAALVALTPLGIVLVIESVRAEGGIANALRRHRGVAVILAVIVVTVAVSLLNFEDGNRWLRRVANMATVALVLFLISRYLNWSRRTA